MTYATKTLRQQYRVRAHNIGSNAIRLVNDYFLFGVQDDVINKASKYPFVDCNECQWTLTDLDRALDAMHEAKLKRHTGSVVNVFYKES